MGLFSASLVTFIGMYFGPTKLMRDTDLSILTFHLYSV